MGVDGAALKRVAIEDMIKLRKLSFHNGILALFDISQRSIELEILSNYRPLFIVIKFNDFASLQNIIYNNFFMNIVDNHHKLKVIIASCFDFAPGREQENAKPQSSSLNEMEVN